MYYPNFRKKYHFYVSYISGVDKITEYQDMKIGTSEQ